MAVIGSIASAGRQGSGTSAATKKTKDFFEAVLGLCEGPIAGLHDGDKSFYLGDTPLADAAGNPNFTDIDVEILPGDPSPAPVKFQLGGAASSTSVGVQLFTNTAVTRSTISGAIDAIEVRLAVQQLFVSDNDGLKNNTCNVTIEYKASTSSTWLPFTATYPFEISGQFTATDAIEFRKNVDRLGGGAVYNIRVTKTSPESTAQNKRDILFESFQEVVTQPLTFDNTAIAHVTGQVSNQISGLPELSGIYDGMLLQVPTNYDPVARTYTGIWDGTFKTAWTNNPAWVLYNAIMNARWGLNSYYTCTIDKFDCYDAGQWCDELVSDGASGLQPRFTFNAYITEAMNGKDLIAQIAASFNARIYDDLNGTLVLKLDRDEDPVMLFTPENVINGEFEYAYTDLNTRYNEITVTFLNPLLNYQEDRRRIINQDHIDLHGLIPFPMIALGCTDQQQASRVGMHRLISALTEKEQVSFKTNRLAAQVQPFEVILVADPDMGYATTARIKSLSVDRKTITLRDPITIAMGDTYDCKFETKNGILAEAFTGATTGSVTSITFVSPLPAGIENLTAFSIGTGSSYGTPKPYRVLRIAEEGTDQISISAIEINAGKWDAVDAVEFVGNTSYSDRSVSTFVHPPSNLIITQADRPDGTPSLLLVWDESTDRNLSRYRIEFSKDGEVPQLLTETTSRSARLDFAQKGTYTFYLYAVNIIGFTSAVLTGVYFIDGPTAGVPEITGLEIEGQGHNTIFTTKHVKFSWRVTTGQSSEIEDVADSVSTDPLFKDYVFEVINPATNLVVFRDWTQQPSYNFTYDMNVQSGGPFRTFTVRVRYRDRYNRMSTAKTLTVTNPAPAQIPVLHFTNGPGFTTISAPKSSEIDIAGYRFWMDIIPGFTPGPANLVYDGPNNAYQAISNPGVTIYVRATAYDVYDSTTVNVSNEFSNAIPLIAADYLDAAIISALASADPSTIELIKRLLKGHNDDLNSIDETLLKLSLNVNQVSAQAGAAQAYARQEVSALATQTASYASIISEVQASFADNIATVNSNLVSLATTDSVLASRADSLDASLGSVNGSIATINSQLITLANADTTFAGSLTSLTTTVNGHTTTISTHTSSLNGLNAQWGVTIDSNGRVIGLTQLDGTNNQATFTVVANNFYFYDSVNGARAMFAITGGQAYFNVPLNAGLINATTIIANNIITRDHLQNGSSSGGINQNIAGAITIPADGSTVTLASDTFPASGGDVLVDINTTAALTSAGSVTVVFELWQDGNLKATREMANLVYLTPQNLAGSHDGFGELNLTMFVIPSDVATSTTWYLKAHTPDGIDVQATNRKLFVKDWFK
jgi:hypothetical protein